MNAKNDEKIYKLSSLNWLFSKLDGTIEPVVVIENRVMSVYDGKPFDDATKMIVNGKTESDSLLILDANTATRKYAAKGLNAYSFNLHFFEEDGFGSVFDDFIKRKNLSEEELKKLTELMTKNYKKVYQKINLSRVHWLVDINNSKIEPFMISLDTNLPISPITGDVIAEIVDGSLEKDKQVKVLNSQEAILKYGTHKFNKFTFMKNFTDDGLIINNDLVEPEYLKKLAVTMQEGLEKYIAKYE